MPLPDNYQAIADRFGFDFLTCGFGQTESGLPLAGLIHTSSDERRKPEEYRRGLQPPAVVDRVESLGIPVVSEVPGDRFMAEPASQYMEATVVDEQGEECPPGKTGELICRPKLPGIILRQYHGKPQLTVEAFRDLWFHTGDAAYHDEEGYYFVDRIGDVIRRRGENISSIQIQEEVNALEEVADGAVFPIPASAGGEDDIAAAIVPAENGVNESVIREFLADRLPEFMIPDEIVFIDEIPTTETNKRRKTELKDEFF
jgi:crotonobetaine/carnitine-CoA ligase